MIASKRTQRYFTALDDLGVELEDATRAAQNDPGGSLSRLASIKRRLVSRVNRELRRGGQSSVGANLLISNAGNALEAAKRQDVARLAQLR